MAVDLITLMEFEQGTLSEDEVINMLEEMVNSGEIKTLPDKFNNLAKQYIRKGLIKLEE